MNKEGTIDSKSDCDTNIMPASIMGCVSQAETVLIEAMLMKRYLLQGVALTGYQSRSNNLARFWVEDSGPLHTQAKSRDGGIARAQKKVPKGRPKHTSKIM